MITDEGSALMDGGNLLTAGFEDLLTRGDVVAERYRVGWVLDTGGYALVYEGVRIEDGTEVVIKALRRQVLKIDPAVAAGPIMTTFMDVLGITVYFCTAGERLEQMVGQPHRGLQRLQLTEEDFRDLALAYFDRAAADNVRHAEIFFDPQTHTDRGVPIGVVINGLHRACQQAQAQLDRLLLGSQSRVADLQPVGAGDGAKPREVLVPPPPM